MKNDLTNSDGWMSPMTGTCNQRAAPFRIGAIDSGPNLTSASKNTPNPRANQAIFRYCSGSRSNAMKIMTNPTTNQMICRMAKFVAYCPDVWALEIAMTLMI